MYKKIFVADTTNSAGHKGMLKRIFLNFLQISQIEIWAKIKRSFLPFQDKSMSRMKFCFWKAEWKHKPSKQKFCDYQSVMVKSCSLIKKLEHSHSVKKNFAQFVKNLKAAAQLDQGM